ncbi:M4 family metallopeptidase [Chryseobacterium sp.]|uniref:M4 family metallopeptidase n=1 Tax=Chryseobacterium sp. TaxID=1871047 RepID=UPI00388D827D
MKKSLTFVKLLSFVVSVAFIPSLGKAQTKTTTKTETTLNNYPTITKTSDMNNFYASFEGTNITQEKLASHFSKWFKTNNEHSLKFVDATTDDLGFKRSEYQHYYKDVLVADERVFVHEKEGRVTYVNGEYSDNINLTIVQPPSKTEVEDIIKRDMNAADVTFSDFKQVVVKAYVDEGVELRLASQINALSLKNIKGYLYYIDNTSKQIVKKLSTIQQHNYTPQLKIGAISEPLYPNLEVFKSPLIDAPSTSTTYFKGNQNITVDSYNGSYRLKDNARNIHTRNGAGWDGSANLATGELTGTITEYTSSTSNFTEVVTKPAVEVHWAMKIAKDYYISRHNRNSYDGNGSVIRNYYDVNFGSAAEPSGANAAAVDTQGIVAMVYGNGFFANSNAPSTNINAFYPFVGIDVAGHEYSHLIVSRTANLAYQKESGALNESFADMFGAAIEFYSGITPNWNIGEGLCNPAYISTNYLRSMSNPNAGPAPISGQQPDTYLTGTYWQNASSTCTPISDGNDPNYNDSCGVHTNSGVGNFWFYLLSVGGSGTNDSGISYNVTGITIQKAEKIAYRTLATYLTSNSAYINAYNSSKQAAIDLNGAGSNELQQVENAWCAVGLGNCASLLDVNESTKAEQNDFKIYPNPIKNGQFTIENHSKDATFEIYDLSGKIIKTAEKLLNGKNEVQIIGTTAGVYMVKIQADGKTITKKIINK